MPPERDLMHRTPTAEIHEVFSLNRTTRQQQQQLHMQPTNETLSFPFLWWDLARHLFVKVDFAAFFGK